MADARVVIRPARPTDEDAVRACAQAAYAGYIALIGRAPAPMEADFAAEIADGRIHVATDASDSLLGYLSMVPDVSVMHLGSVAVLPNHAGKGLGRALIAHCEGVAQSLGLRSVALYTNAAMQTNLTLYPSLGYRQVDRRVEDGFDRVFFVKTLD